MKRYAILVKEGHYVSVKQGWSWPGFFFEGIWTLTKNLWTVSIFVVPATILSLTAFPFLSMGISLICGNWGNSWVIDDYENKGYRIIRDGIQALTPEQALEKYKGMK